ARLAHAPETSIASLLASLQHFAELDPTVLQAVAAHAVRRAYETGQVVFLEGEPCAGVHIVERGHLKSVRTSLGGREQVIRVVGPGELFNEVSTLVERPNHVTVIALEPTVVWAIPSAAVRTLLELSPALCCVIMRNLAERLLYLVDVVEDLSLRSVEARLARLLLEHSSEGALERRRWTTQGEMASRLGTVPDVLHRALHSLADAGLIEIRRQQICILDRAGLENRALSDK
ncbi:MAG: Crp/Fnr family transcriptional regulator, partial [Anaerolineales bacterium]|nr:Crp/Fnr family transcriptional regulator [Anaerolineales bacterium]